MTGFQTDVSQMANAAAHVQEVNASVHTLLRGLRDEVATVGSHWRGAAQASFVTMMSRYDASGTTLNHALAGIAEQLSAASRDYSARDAQHEGAFRSVGSGLNMS
jgi:WXG100 family type VII secretion target